MYNAGRRIRFLMAAIILAVIVYSAIWFVIAAQVDSKIGDTLARLARDGILVECAERDVRGFPFRIGVFCADLNANMEREDVRVNAGALRSAAQVYDPQRIIFELDSPVEIAMREQVNSLRLDWELGRAVVALSGKQLTSISGEAVNGVINVNGPRAQRIEYFARDNGEGVDLAGRALRVTQLASVAGLSDIPVFDVDFDLTINDKQLARLSPDLQSLRGTEGNIKRIGIGLTDDRGVIAQGPFSVSEQGLLSAEIRLRAIDVPGLLDVFAAILPNQIGMIESVLSANMDGDEASATIIIRDGNVMFGFIPLAQIPAF